ncbi:MAG: hypothetical protein ACFFD4_01890 [Candidatus Odinarchaeota archaeon]
MADAFTTWLNALLLPLTDAYSQMLEGFPLNFFSYVISAFMLGIVMQAIFMIIPPLKAAVDAIMFPFRMLHVWLHVQAARGVMTRQQVNGERGGNSLRFISYFSTGSGTRTEKTGFVLSGTCTPREASTIANAPLKGALALLMLLTLLTPFFRTSFLGKLIHLYIFTGIATASFPSGSDYRFTYNMVLLNAALPSPWLLLPAAVFTAGFITVIYWSGNIVLALVAGLGVSTLGTWLLLMVATWQSTKTGKSSLPETEENYSSDASTFQTDYTTDGTASINHLLYQLEDGH